jgi:hypothetical protein
MMDLKDLISRLRSGAIHPNEFDQIADILEKSPEYSRQNYKTRADLMSHPDFKDLDTDTSGNPCVWRNYYHVRREDNSVSAWSSDWSCQCDDDGIEPYESDWLPTGGDESIDLWESLPEKGA